LSREKSCDVLESLVDQRKEKHGEWKLWSFGVLEFWSDPVEGLAGRKLINNEQ